MGSGARVRDLLWDSVLTADLNQRYFVQLADGFRRQDQWAKLGVAVFSSGSALASWALWKQPGVQWAWPVLSGAAAIAAIALPIFDPANSLKAASGLSGAWFALFREYELLWAQVDSMSEEKMLGQLQTMGSEEKRLAEMETGFSTNKGIAARCEAEVRTYYTTKSKTDGGTPSV